MIKKIYLLSFLLFSFQGANVQKMSVLMTTRSTHSGKTSMLKAEIAYHISGTMTSHFIAPSEQYILNNAKGEVSVFNPQNNTVLQQVNYLFSTETTQFYYFLNNQKSDLGLKKMGFLNKNTRFENDMMITNWVAPAKIASQIKEIELVHKNGNPIYTKYIKPDGSILKKVYYYNYLNTKALDFPQSVTQIEFFSAKDSVISKTSYSDFKINELANTSILDFKIPKNAKILK